MIHNDILRRLRYSLDYSDDEMLEVFALAGCEMDRGMLIAIMRREGDRNFIECTDQQLAAFLDGLIVDNRGIMEGREPRPLPRGHTLSNNEILRKLRIALKLRDEDIIEILGDVDYPFTKSQLSALFRKPTHRNYQACGDQLLRNFIAGLAHRYR